MSCLTAAQDGALLELSLNGPGLPGRVPKWRTHKTIEALIGARFIERVTEPAFPRRFRITEAGHRHLERKAGKSL